MTLKEACTQALTILKQVMEEKLSSTNVEVSHSIDNLCQYDDTFCLNVLD